MACSHGTARDPFGMSHLPGQLLKASAPPQALRVELTCSVLVLFFVAEIKHPDRSNERQKGSVWLTVAVYSSSLQRGQGNGNLKQLSHPVHSPGYSDARKPLLSLISLSLCSPETLLKGW